ncbi:MAG: BatA domain-containing protein [Cyanobacteria bacterium]|nr:BatA domain-containing protein [Cyanobacteriota bacterium]
MSIFWTAPAALLGLTLIALPIAIHLLARQNIRTLPYPSLRFLKQTQLAAFRRRAIEDAALLLCRAAIISVAVLALAGPVLQTPARQAAYAKRVSRAIVLTRDGVDRDAVDRAAEGVMASTIVVRMTMADALAEATRWLDQQPPSAREIVTLGALRRGALNDADLSAVDRDIGIRFLPVAVETPSTIVVPVLTRRNDTLVTIDRQVRADAAATQVIDGPAIAAPADLIRIVASPGDTALAEAALRAALDAGIPWADLNQHIVIAWDGASTGALESNTRLIRMEVPSPPSAAADAVRAVLLSASPPRLREPVLVSAEQLAAWTRPAGAPSPGAPIADEGDRRWLWALALLLLLVESYLRRSAAAAQVEQSEEARVA